MLLFTHIPRCDPFPRARASSRAAENCIHVYVNLKLILDVLGFLPFYLKKCYFLNMTARALSGGPCYPAIAPPAPRGLPGHPRAYAAVEGDLRGPPEISRGR